MLAMTNRWRQPEETHTKFTNLSHVIRDIFCFTPPGVILECSLSLGRDVFCIRQSNTAGKTFREKAIVRQFAQPNNSIFAGDDPVLDTTKTENDSEMRKEVEETKLFRMAKVTTTFRRCGTATKIYMLHRRNLTRQTSR